jgi:hypothetical protein
VADRRVNEPSVRGDAEPPVPAELRELVTRCVRASHTRGRDRVVVERELIGHLQDALDAGCSIARIVADFGDPKRSGVLIGRARVRLSGGRRRNAIRVAASGAAAAAAFIYVTSAVSLHSRSPAALVPAHESVPPALLERDAIDEVAASSLIDTLLDRMYADSPSGHGTLTADGLRIVQRLKGVTEPSRTALVIEPVYFAFPASRRDVRREADRVLALARTARAAGPASNAWAGFEREVARFGWTRPGAYRYVPLAIVLPELAASMRTRAARAPASAVRPN